VHSGAATIEDKVNNGYSSCNPHPSRAQLAARLVAIIGWKERAKDGRKQAFARSVALPYETAMSIERTLYYQIFRVADCQTITRRRKRNVRQRYSRAVVR